jgi:hypothetical protein
MVRNNLIKSKNKRGWVKLVEVFIAILLLAGVLFIISNKGSSDKKSFNEDISKKETAILRDIELNNTMRTEILNIDSASFPIEWDDFGPGLQDVKDRILYLTPQNMNCEAKICLLNDICTFGGTLDKDIYAESVVISADLSTYSPRQLKLFCMMK